jgi:hypothetical protein
VKSIPNLNSFFSYNSRAKRWEEDQIRIAESDKLCEGALAKLAKVAHTMNPTISSLGNKFYKIIERRKLMKQFDQRNDFLSWVRELLVTL